MFFSKFERFVAGRYLRSKKKEGFVSVVTAFAYIATALGVATLIIVMSVFGGFRHDLLGRILGINGHITITAHPAYPFTNYLEARDEIRKIDNVATVIPYIEGQVLVSSTYKSSGAIVRGVSKESIFEKEILNINFKHINMNEFEGNSVVVGNRLARSLGLREGDDITIISPNGKVTAFGTVPRMKAYKIIGTFDVGMYEYDSTMIFMPLETAQIYFNNKGSVSNIDVTLNDSENLKPVKYAIKEAVGYDANVYDWQQTNSSFFNAVNVERNMMFLVLTLIVLVAGFNIITALIMIVKDKGKDVAVLRTMGATKGMIIRIFFMDGAFIGSIGTGIGFVIGYYFCKYIKEIQSVLENISGTELFSAEIYFLSHLPARIDPVEVASIVALTLFVTFLATLYPAYRASKFEPVEALRYE